MADLQSHSRRKAGRAGKAAVLLLIMALFLAPVMLQSHLYVIFILCTIGIYVIVNSGLDIVYGYSGQISIGQAGFYAIGAYVSALLSVRLGMPVLLTMIVGALAAAVVGIIIAVPATRVEHHFLALVTIGFGEIVWLVFQNGGSFTGGADGIVAIPPLKLGSLEFSGYGSYYYVILVSVVLSLTVKASLINSRIGRAFTAIKYNPQASAAFGVDLMRYKVTAFAMGAFYAGLGGALYAHLIWFVSPETFTLNQSVLFLAMVLLGGAGTLWGPVIGTVLLIVVLEVLQGFGTYQMAVYGVIIMLILFFMPQGIAGGIEGMIRKRKAARPV
jgi:branched-chain amino acid transport system permease protein